MIPDKLINKLSLYVELEWFQVKFFILLSMLIVLLKPAKVIHNIWN